MHYNHLCRVIPWKGALHSGHVRTLGLKAGASGYTLKQSKDVNTAGGGVFPYDNVVERMKQHANFSI